ncbi:hypothetical protein ACVWZK_004407 [Bradyrhizobium sp. GM0.4]
MNFMAGASAHNFASADSPFRPLQRDQRAVSQLLDDAIVREIRAQMRLVLGLAGGVDDQEEVIAETGDHQIIQNPALGIGELGVALPARRDRHDILRHQPFQRAGGVLDLAGFRPERDLAHVGDVEQAGCVAGMKVLLQDSGRILHGHVIARERHHLAAERDMQVVKGGAFQGVFVVTRKHRGALGGSPGTISRGHQSKPHLSLCLRVLSRRRTLSEPTL